MNSEVFMPDATPEERLQALQDAAASTEVGTYYRPLTPEDLDAKREVLAENAIKLSELDDEKKLAMEEFKAQIKPLTEKQKALLTEIKSRQETKTGTLYHLRDFDDKMVTAYNEHGEFVYTRKLRPDEKQKPVFAVRGNRGNGQGEGEAKAS